MSETSPNQPNKQTVQSETRRLRKKLFLGGLVSLCLFGFAIWICLFREVPLEISPETTYITEPLTADGKQVDYLRALELEFESPDIATDKNGYRMIVQAFGVPDGYNSKVYLANRFCKKLKIDASTQPTMVFEKPGDFIKKYAKKLASDEEIKGLLDVLIVPSIKTKNTEYAIGGNPSGMAMGMEMDLSMDMGMSPPDVVSADELMKKLDRPWTLEEMPMMADWLRENEPALELVARAVRQPCFCIPKICDDEEYKNAPFEYQLIYSFYLYDFERAFQVRANYRIANGDLDGAIEDILSLKMLGRHLSHSNQFFGGITVERLATLIPIAGSQEYQPTKAQLQRLLDSISDTTGKKMPVRASIKDALLMERYMALDAIQKFSNADIAQKKEILKCYHDMDTPDGLDDCVCHLGLDWNRIAKRINWAYDHPESESNYYNVSSVSFKKLLFPSSRTEHIANILTYRITSPELGDIPEYFYQAEYLDQLQAITLAMLIYEKQYGHLPPAWTVDSQGKPLHSWRVLLLPYLGEEAKKLYGKIRLDELWDSERNRKFHKAATPFYQCPGAGLSPGATRYSVVVGPKTAFHGGEVAKFNEFSPHQANLILVTERTSPVCWMEPNAELTQETLSGDIEAGYSSGSKLFGFRSGSVYSLGYGYLSGPYPFGGGMPGGGMPGMGPPPSWENLQKLLEGNMEKIEPYKR